MEVILLHEIVSPDSGPSIEEILYPKIGWSELYLRGEWIVFLLSRADLMTSHVGSFTHFSNLGKQHRK